MIPKTEKSKSTPLPRVGIQTLLPLFPSEATLINNLLAVQEREGQVYYFNGAMPIFMHSKSDIDAFRYISSQLIFNGNCKQTDIVKTFQVSPISVKRWVKRYKQSNVLSDFVSKKKRESIKN